MPSWVKGFLGQTKCVLAQRYLVTYIPQVTACAEILQNGEVRLYWNYGRNHEYLSPVPWQASAVRALIGGCYTSYENVAVSIQAEPMYSNPQVLNGDRPYDWKISASSVDGCYEAPTPGGYTVGGFD